MEPRHTIVIPYTSVTRVQSLLQHFLATPPSAEARIELHRLVLPGESSAELSERLFSEFRALQSLAENHGHRIEIRLNRPVPSA